MRFDLIIKTFGYNFTFVIDDFVNMNSTKIFDQDSKTYNIYYTNFPIVKKFTKYLLVLRNSKGFKFKMSKIFS